MVEPEAGDETFPFLNILLEDFILEGQTGRGEFFFLPSEEGYEMPMPLDDEALKDMVETLAKERQ